MDWIPKLVEETVGRLRRPMVDPLVGYE